MRKILYIFGLLSDADVEWIARTGVRREAGGQELIREGRPVGDLFFVLDGEVSVTVSHLGEVARLGRGEVLGEMSLIDSAPPSATVTGLAGCRVLVLDRGSIDRRLRQDTGFAARFYKALAIFVADRLRAVQARRTGALRADEVMEDELDETVLDGVSLAGLRFERMMAAFADQTVPKP